MIFDFIWNSIQLALAGIWSQVWHWGVGVGAIILCLAAAYFSNYIPVIGPWLGRERKALLAIAAAIGLILVGEAIGAKDEAKKCEARTVVIEKVVTKATDKAKKSRGSKSKDPFDSPEN